MSFLTKRLSITVAFAALFLLFSCAVPISRYIAQPTPPVELNREAVGADGFFILLRYDIPPNGPGSWVREAKWREFPLEIRNRGRQDACLDSWTMLDKKGVYINSMQIAGFDLYPSEADRTKMALDNTVSGAVTGPLGGIALGSIFSSLPVWALAGAGGQFTSGIFGSAFMAPSAMQAHSEAKDREYIQNEIAKRNLDPSCLAPDGFLTKSIFFPADADPSELIFKYRAGRQEKQLKMLLPPSAPALAQAR